MWSVKTTGAFKLYDEAISSAIEAAWQAAPAVQGDATCRDGRAIFSICGDAYEIDFTQMEQRKIGGRTRGSAVQRSAPANAEVIEEMEEEEVEEEEVLEEEQKRPETVLAGDTAARKPSGAYPLDARLCKWGGRLRNRDEGAPVDARRRRVMPAEPIVAGLKHELESFLTRHARELFNKQHRSANSFDLKGDFTIGTGSTNPGFICHFENGLPGFVKHPTKNIAFHVRPVDAQLAARKISQLQFQAYELARQLLEAIDADYAAGEFLVQFALMDETSARVGCHVDAGDISYQYALALGNFSGAMLRCYTSRAKTEWVDLDTKGRVAKFDGRLPHEVVTHDFRGQRFTVIVYKNYDHRKHGVDDPVFGSPRLVS